MTNARLIFMSCLAILLSSISAIAQSDAARWEDEVKQISEANKDVSGDDIIVFTGSSSIRMWKDIKDRFPEYNIVNSGFGGSAMHELNYWKEDLILKYNPSKVFIYEGDNDVSAGLTPEFVLGHTSELTNALKAQNSNIQVYLISAKPSPSRWNLKKEYHEMNNALEAFSKEEEGVSFIDVWPSMLNDEGLPMENIFIEDNLHMNEIGYDIWEEVISPYLEE